VKSAFKPKNKYDKVVLKWSNRGHYYIAKKRVS